MMKILPAPPKRILELIRYYRTTFKNWYSIALSLYRGETSKQLVKLSNEQQLLLTPEEIVKIAGLKIVYLDEDRVTFRFKNREVTLYGWRLGFPGDSFTDYSRLKVEGKNVLDIGGAIGDSPIYFSLSGAKRVVAVEGDEEKVRYMRKNLEINGIKNVEVIDKFVSTADKDKEISVNSLIKLYGPFDVAKVDCDGCEKIIIPELKETVPEMLIEWDNSPGNLIEVLKSKGYEVKNEYTLYRSLGFIHAKRKEINLNIR